MTSSETSPAEAPEVMGGFSALAESTWIGAAQATEILEPLHEPHEPLSQTHRPGFMGLLTREFTIPEATVILAGSFFVSAFLGSIRQVLFNAEFGAGMEASAYYAAFRLPDTLFSLIAGGALSSAMIPILLSTLHEDGARAAQRLTNLVLTTLLAVFALLVFIGAIFTPFFVNHLLAPGFDRETAALTSTLTRIMLVQPVILAVGTVATAVLNSRNQFLLTALSVMSHNICLIGGILAVRAFPELGIYGPTIGVVLGALLQVSILAPGILAGGGRPRFAWAPRDRRLGEVIHLLIPNGLAVGVGYLGFILDTSFASRAAETEALPAIQNAWMLVGLPLSLLGQAVGQAAFPRLAARAAERDWRGMRRTLLMSLGGVVLLSIPAAAGLLLLGRTIISVVLEHGAFDSVAGDLTYRVMAAYALALPFYVATEVITRGLISMRDTRTPLLVNVCQLGGRIGIMAAFVQSEGVVAVPYALAVTATVESLVLASILAVKLRRRERIRPPD